MRDNCDDVNVTALRVDEGGTVRIKRNYLVMS